MLIGHIGGLICCAAIIFFAGRKLSYYGDLLSDKTGLGKAWIGLILMSFVTSLPELMVGFSSSAIIQSADLAVGDILGSCAFNLCILSLMDMITPKSKPLLSSVSKSHILAASFSSILLILAGMGMFFGMNGTLDFSIIPSLGFFSIAFIVIYFMAIRIIYNFQKVNSGGANDLNEYNNIEQSLKFILVRFALFALVLIAAALVLPYFVDHIAESTGIGKSFAGSVFLAISTSLPEMAVSLAAVRMGAVEMAVGNLLGSNIFNFVILFADDVFYVKGNLLKDAAEINLLTVFFVLLMTAVTIIGLVFPSKEKKLFLAWETLCIFLLYSFNMVLLFHSS